MNNLLTRLKKEAELFLMTMWLLLFLMLFIVAIPFLVLKKFFVDMFSKEHEETN